MSHVHMVKGPKAHAHKVSLYWMVFLMLVFLTGATVYLAQFDFGKLNLVVTLMIAGTKALLVMGIFMHLAFDNKFYGVIAAASLVFLTLFILFPLYDMETRGDIDADNRMYLPRDERVYKYELEHPEALPLRPGLKDPDPKNLVFVKPGHH